MSSKRGPPPPSQEYEFPDEDPESSELGAEGATAASAAEPRGSGEPAAGAAGGEDFSPHEADDLVPDLAVFFEMFPDYPPEEQVRLCRGYATYLASLLPRSTKEPYNLKRVNAEAQADPSYKGDTREQRVSWLQRRKQSSAGRSAAEEPKRRKRYWEK